jgi:hypothetical protein
LDMIDSSKSSCSSLGSLSLWLLFLLVPSQYRGFWRIWFWDPHSYRTDSEGHILIFDPISRLVLHFQLITFSSKVMT